ncbi:class F sortase [Fictibacillus norfolkensis]|jgi:sortase A|uniref:Class F sortase n=1 Tax=Fictibacillus norfolkensis TaxID=2762233 RepID=A0ABR8SJD3_9BACL|nr:class F sortase [Fictibacillus norfolkensis]MBD7963508.1 class F sortase [Fictibacillus norfolkensis]
MMKKQIILFTTIFLLSSCSAGYNYESEKKQEYSQNEILVSSQEEREETNTNSAQQTESMMKMNNEDAKKPNDTESIGIVPTKIEIPALKVSASVNGQGLNKDGQMEVPDNGEDVGWYELGAKPGANGNAVIAGHVDDYRGPAVFFYLKNLKAGDLIHVYGKGNEKVSFQVEKVVAYKKDEAPLRVIFGPSQQPRLNLITCTGVYNRKNNEHEKRLVVYAKRIKL